MIERRGFRLSSRGFYLERAQPGLTMSGTAFWRATLKRIRPRAGSFVVFIVKDQYGFDVGLWLRYYGKKRSGISKTAHLTAARRFRSADFAHGYMSGSRCEYEVIREPQA